LKWEEGNGFWNRNRGELFPTRSDPGGKKGRLGVIEQTIISLLGFI